MFYKKDLVAVDIGSSCIKVLEYQCQNNNKYHLISQPMVESIPRGIIERGEISDAAELSKIFKVLCSRSKLISRIKRCSLSIGSGATIVRRFEIDDVSGAGDLGERVGQQADQALSNFDELQWGYSVLGTDAVGKTAVVFCAIKIDVIESYLSVIHGAGIKAGVIDSSITSVSNAFLHNYENLSGMNMVIDIGASSSNLICFVNNQFAFARTFNIGGDYYTSCLANDLGIEQERAESLKANLAQSGNIPPQVAQSLIKAHESFVTEVSLSIDYFNRSSIGLSLGDMKLQSIFLVGGGSKIPGLVDTISTKLQVNASRFNPFRRIVPKISRSQRRDLEEMGSFFGVSSGLAIRRVGD
ncbi:MAG: pilus assembly protein PilM [Proteobacteria bacterium]|nr:pilus assembly protein PilM [Pseudomonadota bacterium]